METGTVHTITSGANGAGTGLRLVRLPGPFGPVLRCHGRLDATAAAQFRHAAALLAPLGHRAVIVNLGLLDHLDEAGWTAVIDACQMLRREGVRAVLVMDAARAEHAVSALDLERDAPIARSEEEAQTVLWRLHQEERWPARSWEDAQRAALQFWRQLDHDLDRVPAAEAARRLTGMHALCEKSEDVICQSSVPPEARCEFCPLFHALGGRPQDLGCDSVIDPILEALSRSDRQAARAGVRHILGLLEKMSAAGSA